MVRGRDEMRETITDAIQSGEEIGQRCNELAPNSLIRSSLSTAVFAFGVAATQLALGLVFVVTGKGLTVPRPR